MSIQNVALALLLASVATPAFAAPTDPNGHGTGSSPSGQVYPGDGQPVLQIAANTDEQTATVSASFNVWPTHGVGAAQRTILSVAAQTPLGQGDDFTNVATLDGLTKATSISFKFAYLDGGFNPGKTGLNFENDPEFTRQCWTIVNAAPDKPDDSTPGVGICDITVMKAAIAKQDNAVFQQELLNKANALWAAETAGLAAPIWILAANGTVGYEQHVFYDPLSLAQTNANKTPFQVGVELTHVFADGTASINLSFNYQRSFEDSNNGVTQTACKSSAAPVLSCVSGFIGAPTLANKELFEIDARWIPTVKLFGTEFPVGFDPGITYDANADSEAVQFPIYLFTSDSKQLSGGIRYNWTSTNHQSVVGVFVSAAFGILSGDLTSGS
jgi:hypothetical protein